MFGDRAEDAPSPSPRPVPDDAATHDGAPADPAAYPLYFAPVSARDGQAESWDDGIEHHEFAAGFTFVSDSAGVIRSVAGAPREALIGHSIAVAGVAMVGGVTEATARAFQRRLPIQSGDLAILGNGPTAGAWRIWGRPRFGADGNFTGYEGVARRPPLARADLSGTPVALTVDPAASPELTRQVVHELRTPLNTIRGFAEMIEGEVLGPASPMFRSLAGEIVDEADCLTDMIEDLDLLAGLEHMPSAYAKPERATDLVAALDKRVRVARLAGASVSMTAPAPIAAIRIAPEITKRILKRLVGITAGYAGEAEHVEFVLNEDRDGAVVTLTVAMPAAIADVERASLRRGVAMVDGDWPDAPAFGLGFAFRLIAKVADTFGGSFDVEGRQFVLRLPTIRSTRRVA